MRGALSSAVLPLRVACRRSVFALNLTDSCLSTRVTAGKPPSPKTLRDSSACCRGVVSPEVKTLGREGNRLPTCGEVSSVRVAEVRERGEESVLVELGGEFERHDLKYLRKTVDDVLTLRLRLVWTSLGPLRGSLPRREDHAGANHLLLPLRPPPGPAQPLLTGMDERRRLQASILAPVPPRGRCGLPPSLLPGLLRKGLARRALGVSRRSRCERGCRAA